MARKMRLKRPAAKDGANKSFGRRGKHLLSLLFGLVSVYVLAGMEYGDLSSYIGSIALTSTGQDATAGRRRRDFYSLQEAERISGEEPHSHTYIKRTVPGSRHRPLEKAGTTIADASEAPALPLTSDAPQLSLPPLPASSVEEIPRILHYIWPDKNFSTGFEGGEYEQERIELLNRVDNIKSLNPGWEVHVWTDEECEELLRLHFPDFYPTWKTKLKPKLKMWDAVRPAILHTYGGIYLDHDIECTDIGFDEWIDSLDSKKTKLLVRSPRIYSRYTALGNHFMGSVPGHPIWELYIANVIKGISSKRRRRTVTGQTGPGMFGRTYEQYLDMYPELTNSTSIRVLELNQLANTGECEESELYGLLNATMCERSRCIHQRGISPAEIAGEDDNSAKQIAAVKAGKKYTVPKCRPCDRMRRFRKSITKGRAIFIHSPKTAGSTIEFILGLGGSCHVTAAALEACKPEMYQEALTFTIIRNPVDRVISMYDYAKAGGNGKEGDISKYTWVGNATTFEQFVNGLDPFDYSFAPMAHYLYDGTSNSSSIGVKEVLCFDDLAAGWDRLAAIESSLKRGSDGQLVNLTATYRRVGRHNITDLAGATMDKIHKYYGEDFKLWEKYCGGRGSQFISTIV